ncbi:hypothetical protein BH09PAT4_BH09PAT4_03110 [soil metagenome]
MTSKEHNNVQLEDTGERLIPSASKESVVYGEHISRYLAVIDLVKGKRVLDVASGTGYGSQLLAGHARSVIGVDYSEGAIRYAEQHYGAKNLKYFVDDAERLEVVKDKSVDVVISMETIEHLKNPEKFVKQVKRVLVPGGTFVVSTPNDDEYREGNDFHLHEFTFGELKKLIGKYFKKSNFYYQGNALATTFLDKNDHQSEFQREMLVQKTIAVPTKKAIYFIAIASDNKVALPELRSSIAVSQHWNTKGFIEWDLKREKYIKDIEVENRRTKEELESIIASRSWKVTKPLRQIARFLRRR